MNGGVGGESFDGAGLGEVGDGVVAFDGEAVAGFVGGVYLVLGARGGGGEQGKECRSSGHFHILYMMRWGRFIPGIFTGRRCIHVDESDDYHAS